MIKNLISLLVVLSMMTGCGTDGGVKSDSSDAGGVIVGALLVWGVTSLIKKDDLPSRANSSTQIEQNPPNDIDIAANKYFKYIYNHTYTPVKKLGDEGSGYGLYTYIVFNRKTSNHDASEYKEKCNIILHKVQQRLISDNFQSSEKSMVNNFVIPSVSKKTKNIEVQDYNFSLGMKIMDTLHKMAVKSNNKNELTFANEGPFLITTDKPILDTGNVLYFIYADLSNMNKEGVGEVIETYTKKLENRDTGNKPFSKLESARLSMLSHLIQLNDSIKIVKFAFGGE